MFLECQALTQPPNAMLSCNTTDMKTICAVFCEPGCNTFYLFAKLSFPFLVRDTYKQCNEMFWHDFSDTFSILVLYF